MSPRAEDFLAAPLAPTPIKAEKFLASEEPKPPPVRESVLRRLGRLALRAITPFEGPRQLLDQGADLAADSGAFRAVTAALPVVGPAMEAGEALRPGTRKAAARLTASLAAPTPLDVGLLGAGALGKAVGRALGGARAAEGAGEAGAAVRRALGVLPEAPRPAPAPLTVQEATARLEAAATKAPKPQGILSAPSSPPRPTAPEIPRAPESAFGQDVRRVMDEAATANAGKVDEARRGVITQQQTVALAEDLGMSAQDLLKRRRGEAFNAEQALGARQVLTGSAERTWNLAKAVTDGKAPLEDFAGALANHSAVQAEVSGVSAEAGRALQSFKIPPGATKERVLEAVSEALGGREATMEVVERLAKLDPTDTRAVNMFLRDVSQAKTSDKVFEVWVNALLSAPATHAVNALSNTLTLMSRPVLERPVAAGLDFLRATVTHGRRERFAGETAADMVGVARGIPDGVLKALRAFRDELPTFGADKIEVPLGRRQAIKGRLGGLVRIPGRALMAADDFFKVVGRSGELHAQAYREAARAGLKGRQLIERMGQVLAAPGRRIEDAATREAIYRTFQSEGGPAMRGLERLRANVPGLRYVMPFLRTPTNIAKYGLERTPLNFLRVAHQSARGTLRGGELAEELAKPAMGSLIAATVAAYAGEGKITGGGPRDAGRRRALRASGWQPYSVKLKDRYISYARLEPLAIIVGLTADFVELFDQAEKEEAAEKIALAVAQNLSNKTFLRGISELLDAASDPERHGGRWLRNLAGTVVPSGVAAAARAIDPVMRSAGTVPEAIQRRIPGLTEDLPAVRDLWGQPILIPGGPVERLLSPVHRSKVDEDPATREIVRLGMSIGSPQRALGARRLTPEEYDLYAKASGQAAHELVSALVSLPNYARIDDDAREEEIRRRFYLARKAARANVLGATPRARDTADDFLGAP